MIPFRYGGKGFQSRGALVQNFMDIQTARRRIVSWSTQILTQEMERQEMENNAVVKDLTIEYTVARAGTHRTTTHPYRNGSGVDRRRTATGDKLQAG